MLVSILTKQEELQKKLLPDNDDALSFYNAATCAIVEIGEMLQEDTRWKQYVTGSTKIKYDKEKCLEEYCDVILYLINAAIFAGFSYDDVLIKLTQKQDYNFKRFLK